MGDRPYLRLHPSQQSIGAAIFQDLDSAASTNPHSSAGALDRVARRATPLDVETVFVASYTNVSPKYP